MPTCSACLLLQRLCCIYKSPLTETSSLLWYAARDALRLAIAVVDLAYSLKERLLSYMRNSCKYTA